MLSSFDMIDSLLYAKTIIHKPEIHLPTVSDRNKCLRPLTKMHRQKCYLIINERDFNKWYHFSKEMLINVINVTNHFDDIESVFSILSLNLFTWNITPLFSLTVLSVWISDDRSFCIWIHCIPNLWRSSYSIFYIWLFLFLNSYNNMLLYCQQIY